MKIWNHFNNLQLRQRLLWIFFIGCVLPMLLADIYIYQSVRKMMVEQAKESAVEELSIIADSIGESIAVVEDVSKRLYFDEMIEQIATKKYDNYEDILQDYRDFTTIERLLKYYYQEIASITIYTYNTTLSNNEYFVYADATVKSDSMYINSMNLAGSPYWAYKYDERERKNCLSMSRVLYDRNLEKIGMITMVMQNKRTQLPVQQRNEDTYLFYDDIILLHSNCEGDYDEIATYLTKNDTDVFSEKIKYEGADYLLSSVRVRPPYSNHYYTLVSMQPYKEIARNAANTAMHNLIPMMICIIIALGVIGVFSNSFSARINTFKEQMHKAANGDFDIAESIEGKDEIAQLYQDLNAMIKDIQELMSSVVKEQVQKEQLHTRQREVEFKMLASQINPHFLYNTLETIRMQARVKGQAEIEELTKMLAKIMRRNIQAGDTMQSMRSELQLIEYYLKIQDYRFHDRIHYEILVENEEIYDQKVLPLLIQPFVENAFAHGLEGKEKDGLIQVRTWIEEDLMHISVFDNGCGMTPEQLEETRKLLNDFENLDRTHIGICNVNERIKLCYGEEYGVTITSDFMQGTTVIITIPKNLE